MEPDWKTSWKKHQTHSERRHKKLLSQLKSQPGQAVRKRGGALHNEVFQKVDCMQCANCCKSIPPLLNETDVSRISKSLGMNAGEFKVKYVVFDDDGDMVINASPCPFLEDDNACSIYEIRPRACRQYPHTDEQQFAKYLDLHLVNARYCPAVFHILERLGSLPV